MKTTTPPRLSAKKVKKAPHNPAINQYWLVNTFLNVSIFIRDIEGFSESHGKIIGKEFKNSDLV